MPRSTPFGYRNASYYEPVPRRHKIVLSRSAFTLGTVSFQTCPSAWACIRIGEVIREELPLALPAPRSVRRSQWLAPLRVECLALLNHFPMRPGAEEGQVLGKASNLHDDVTDCLDCRSVVKRQFRFGSRRISAGGRHCPACIRPCRSYLSSTAIHLR